MAVENGDIGMLKSLGIKVMLFFLAECHSGRGILFFPCPQNTLVCFKLISHSIPSKTQINQRLKFWSSLSSIYMSVIFFNMYTFLGHLVLNYFLQLMTVQSEMALSIQWVFLNEK